MGDQSGRTTRAAAQRRRKLLQAAARMAGLGGHIARFEHENEPGMYYLGDAGYALKKDVLTPYQRTRYHVKEWAQRRLEGMHELFNYHHVKIRNAIERCFVQAKRKWPILKEVPEYDHDTQSKIIIGCFALHNFVKDMKDYANGQANYAANRAPLDLQWLYFNGASTDGDMKRVRQDIADAVCRTFGPRPRRAPQVNMEATMDGSVDDMETEAVATPSGLRAPSAGEDDMEGTLYAGGDDMDGEGGADVDWFGDEDLLAYWSMQRAEYEGAEG